MVDGDNQLIIVEDSVDEGIDQPMPVGLLAHVQNPELVQVEQGLLLRALMISGIVGVDAYSLADDYQVPPWGNRWAKMGSGQPERFLRPH